MRGKRLFTIGVLAACAALLASIAGAAGAAEVRVGKLVLRADGGFQPNVLPKRKRVPIRFQGHANIRTTDRSAPPPLRHVKLEFDRDGRLTTAGLPVCRPARVEGRTSAQARRRCRGAIVGRGRVGATVPLFGGRIELRLPLTLFNGPRRKGDPTVIGHAHAGFPLFETYVVVAPIERRRGTFGYRTSFAIPPIAGGSGSLTHASAKLGRRYRHRGGRRSYVSARCSTGILQTQGLFSFADGTIISGSVFKPCRNP